LGKKGESVKARLISYLEVEERFIALLAELEQKPLYEETILDKGAELLFILGICVSQMNAPNSRYYPGKEMLHDAKECSKCGKTITPWEDVERVGHPTSWRRLFQISLWEPFVTAAVVVWAVCYGQLWLAAVAVIYELYRVKTQSWLVFGEAEPVPIP
jgi:hypothetical protein